MCEDLQGHIFDCGEAKHADNYNTTMKIIANYISKEYQCGGDIHASILAGRAITIPVPVVPIVVNAA